MWFRSNSLLDKPQPQASEGSGTNGDGPGVDDGGSEGSQLPQQMELVMGQNLPVHGLQQSELQQTNLRNNLQPGLQTGLESSLQTGLTSGLQQGGLQTGLQNNIGSLPQDSLQQGIFDVYPQHTNGDLSNGATLPPEPRSELTAASSGHLTGSSSGHLTSNSGPVRTPVDAVGTPGHPNAQIGSGDVDVSNFFQAHNLGWLLDGHFFDPLEPAHASSEPAAAQQTRLSPPLADPKTPASVAMLPPTTLLAVDNMEGWKRCSDRVFSCLFGNQDLETPESPMSNSSSFENYPFSSALSMEMRRSWVSDPHLLRRYCLCYFDNYHDHFPVIHRQSFLQRPDKVHPFLLIAVATLGTAFAPDEHYQTSVQLHDRLRWLIFSYADTSHSPPVWLFQSLVLLQCFEKMLSTRSLHELASTFHGAMIILLRRHLSIVSDEDEENSGTPQPDNLSDSEFLDRKWRKWIDLESFRRTLYLAFVMDSQHATLFGHTACMSANEIHFELPCLESTWEATTAQEWWDQYYNFPVPPKYLSGLTALLMHKPLTAPTSGFGRLALLHGILSIATHMQLHRSKTLGMGHSPLSGDEPEANVQCQYCGQRAVVAHNHSASDNWRPMLASALEAWSQSVVSDRTLAIEASTVLFELAKLKLTSPKSSFVDFMNVARYPPLTGVRLTARDISKSEGALASWFNTPESIQGLRHALFLIQEVLFPWNSVYKARDSSDQGAYEAKSDKIALRPWCLFLAGLVIWAYHKQSIEGRQGVREVRIEDIPGSRDTWTVAEEFASSSSVALFSGQSPDDITKLFKARPWDVRCLLVAIRTSLAGCRWEMLQQAYFCLGQL